MGVYSFAWKSCRIFVESTNRKFMRIRNKLRFYLLALLLFGVLLFIGGSMIPMPEIVYANDTTYGWHSCLQDVGMGVIALVGGLLVFIVHYKVRKLNDLRTVKTPGKWATVLIANMAVLLLIPGTFLYYSFRGWRGDYPASADSIGIPLLMQLYSILFLLIPLNIFLFLAIWKISLPSFLYMRTLKNSGWLRFWKILLDCLLVLTFLLLVFMIWDGDIVAVISTLMLFYVFLILRTGKVNYYNQRYFRK